MGRRATWPPLHRPAASRPSAVTCDSRADLVGLGDGVLVHHVVEEGAEDEALEPDRDDLPRVGCSVTQMSG